MRSSWLLVVGIGGIVLACSGTKVNRPAVVSKPPPPRTSSAAKKITDVGGQLEADRAQVVIPAGAVKTESLFSLSLVSGADLEGWPQGTAYGFAFEPAGLDFRVPVLIELPNEGGLAEVVCMAATGERTTIPPDATEEDHYHFHVTELPARCAVFSHEHSAALKAARTRHGEVIAKQNGRHKWEVQSELCNPHLFSRPNAERGFEEPEGLGGCPRGMAPIPGGRSCVDRWEAHVVEVLDDGTIHSWSPYFNPGAIKVRARSAPNAVPQGYISQVQAAQACAEAGKRMCTDVEWVAACKGSQKTQWPYGNTEKPTACNDRRDRHPAIEYLESTDVFARLEHPCINQIPDTVFLTGAKTECATPDGVFDMVGNLHEWTADKAGTFRGGYYVEAKQNGRGCDYATVRHDAIYWDYSVGFRCCADLNPERTGSGVRVSPE